HGRVPQPTRHYPRLWIRRPSSERRRDLNPPDQNAAQHTLRPPPPPQEARPGPRGRPVEFTRLAARGFPCCVGSPSAGMPPPIPRWDPGSVSRREGLSPRPPGTTAFPVEQPGRLPHRVVSGLARRSLPLRPACSPSRPRRPVVSTASTVSLPPP